MAINKNTLNTSTLNTAGEGNIEAIGSGSFVDIEQLVAINGSGAFATLWQTVEFRASGSGTFADIEQTLRTVASGSFVNFEQRIRNLANTSNLNRQGWDAVIVINGRNIPHDEISGDISVVRTESDAALATITLRTDIGVQDFTLYQGKDITIDVEVDAGIRRIYTGIVDIIDVDLLEEKLILRCTDKRRERIISNLANVVANTGFYSETVFGKAEDLHDELEKRLTTVPKALDYDSYGQYRITNWEPKSTADYTLTDSDIYYDRPKVELISRGRVINKVNLQINYGYDRKHQRSANFVWFHPSNTNACTVLRDGYSLTSKQMIQDAANGSGWIVNPNGITYLPLFASGWYSCGVGGVSGYVGWSTQRTIGSTQVKRDAKGNAISDSNGNTVYEETERARVIDYSDIYADGASWTATKRWNQNIVEQYALTIESTTSQAAFGIVEQDLSYQIDSTTETSGWETGTGSDSLGTYYINNRDNLPEYQNTVITALNMANTLILSGHRANRAMGRTFINPYLELYHTVRFNTTPVDAKGKVSKLEHKLNIMTGEAYTDIEISMYNIGSGGSNSSLSIPSAPSDTLPVSTRTISLGNYFGIAPADYMTGMIGNAFLYVATSGFGSDYSRTNYQEQFRVDTPEIEKVYRDTRILAGSGTYSVSIPSSTLVVTFDGKS